RYKVLLGTIVVFAVVVVGVTVPDQLVSRAQTIQTYEEDWSAMQRIQAWGVNWNVAKDSFTGAGFQMVYMGSDRWLSYANFLGEWPNEARTAHSNYFQILGHHGFLGLALYVMLLVALFASLLRMSFAAARSKETVWISEYAWALMVGLIGYAVAGAFLDLAYFTLFYAFIALTIVLRREYFLSRASIAEKARQTARENAGYIVGDATARLSHTQVRRV
ncbi:O-antigen ligase family protein, partial [Aquisalimonas sp.]|uniref:O-antigen ligase family protein n=1 Tax=Aquisalimonas sp. TaxID=1872621 RepID=UPI0025C5C6F1